jgi:hypothetical protein
MPQSSFINLSIAHCQLPIAHGRLSELSIHCVAVPVRFHIRMDNADSLDRNNTLVLNDIAW